MKPIDVNGHEAEDIRQQVRKILRGLGNPEPPLRLEEVRELLKLDLQYYSSQNTGVLREVVSRLIVAGKQILHRPTILWDAIKKAELSALWLPDRKRILIDESAPKLKHRWNESHEIIHSVVPWHTELLLGDSEAELSPTCHATIEAEANYGTGQLLFLMEQFADEARDASRRLESIKHLSQRYGNTITSTLWRYVEQTYPDVPVVGIVSEHPWYPSASFIPASPCRHCIQSPAFRAHFSHVSERQLFDLIAGYSNRRRTGPLGEDDILLLDDRDERYVFHFESFAIKYYVLTLGFHVCKHVAQVAI